MEVLIEFACFITQILFPYPCLKEQAICLLNNIYTLSSHISAPVSFFIALGYRNFSDYLENLFRECIEFADKIIEHSRNYLCNLELRY